MIKGFLLVVFLCILRSHAISNGNVATGSADHACMVLVIRKALEGTDTAALGGGSIVSRRHVLTAAHLVYGVNNKYQINFFLGTSRRQFNSTFALQHENFDLESYSYDVALIFLQGKDFFSDLNIIPISTVEVGSALVARTIGYGFTSADSAVASVIPMAANQTVASYCLLDPYPNADTHFCASDSSAIICPGDNGMINI